MCPEKDTTNSYILSLRNWRSFILKSQLFLEDKPHYIITATEQISCMGHCKFVPLKKKKRKEKLVLFANLHRLEPTMLPICLLCQPLITLLIMLNIIDSCCHPQEYKFYTKKI